MRDLRSINLETKGPWRQALKVSTNDPRVLGNISHISGVTNHANNASMGGDVPQWRIQGRFH